MPKLEENLFDVLGEMLTPPPAPAPVKDEKWMPHLTAEQLEVFNAEEEYVLAWSEKGSGKTWGILSKLVRHLYDNQNALAIIGVRVRSMANKGGAWDKLLNFILPEWKRGMGLNYSDVKKDSQHNEFLWVQNRWGTWCCVVLISAPFSSQLRERMPGYEPSFVFWDELTQCDSHEYFRAPAIQLGRRPGVAGKQQYFGACNPVGTSHWVYKKWFEEAFNETTGVWDRKFRQIYFPVKSNEANLNSGYLDSLRAIYKGDAVEAARMLEGKWEDRPDGEGLFSDIFNVAIHVRPLNGELRPDVRNRLLPADGFPIIIGLDPGAVNNAFIYEQWVPTLDGFKWLIFDEAVTIRRRVNYREFVPILQRKVKFWREAVAVPKPNMRQVWVSDNSAFNQYRAASGSFDVLELQKHYAFSANKYGIEPTISIKQAPKFNGSVIARVKLLQTLLAEEKIIISSGCVKVIDMLLKLRGTPMKDGEPFDPEKALTPMRSDWIHTFDALTYPMLLASISPSLLMSNESIFKAA